MDTRLFRMGLALPLASGAAALMHEMLWTRRLIDLLGGSSESSTRVLSLFFLGLSLGAILAQAVLSRVRRPWMAVGVTELAIACLALPALFLPHLTDWLWPWIGREALAGIMGPTLKGLIAALVIMPPATAMGMTLPFFVAGLLASKGTLAREGVWVYALNTIGGLLGLIVASAALLPALGASGAMATAIGINVLAAAACFGMHRLSLRASSQDVPLAGQRSVEFGSEPERGWGPLPGASVGLASLLALGSGVGLLAIEIITLQTVMLAVPLSFFAPQAILATVVGLLAVAAVAVGMVLGRSRKDACWWLPRTLVAAGAAAVISPAWYLTLATLINVESAASVWGFSCKVSLFVLLAFGPLFFLLGLTFPLAMVIYDRSAERDPKRWPWLLAINGVGGLIGAELAYRVLLPGLGVHASLAAVGLGYVGLAIATLPFLRQGHAPSLLSLGGVALILFALIHGYIRKLPQINPYLQLEVLSERVGADGLVAVVQGERVGRGILVSNQYMLGSTSARYDQQRQAQLPLLLHPAPARVAFIGLATGMTPGAAVLDQAVEKIVVSEIAQSVIDAADLYFSAENHEITRHNQARIFREDGRTLVAASPRSFDALIGDLFLPWGSGASRLYSVEHFLAARESLLPGGLFCQWLPMHQLNERQFDLICSSFQRVFPTVYLFRNSADPFNPAIGLVGFRDGELDWNVVNARTTALRGRERIQDPAMLHWETVAMHYLGTLRPVPADSPVITLNNMRLEIDASGERVTGQPASKYLQGERWLGFLSDRLPQLVLPATTTPSEASDATAIRQAEARQYQRVGQQIVKWEWRQFLAGQSTRQPHADPTTELITAEIIQQIPPAVLDSIARYPHAWPGHPALFSSAMDIETVGPP
jgi:spermidine synthase